MLGTSQPAPKKKKTMAKAMDKLSKFHLLDEDFKGRDGIKIRREMFDTSLLDKESVNALYYMFSYAHGTICCCSVIVL